MSHSIDLKHMGCKNTLLETFKEYLDKDKLIGLVCTVCLSEWFDKDFLSHHDKTQSSDQEEICYENHTLLLKPCVDEPIPEITEKEIDPSDIMAGDHVKYPWFCGEYHHVIVKENRDQEMTLIHWQGEREEKFSLDTTDAALKTEVIEEHVVDITKKSKNIYLCDYKKGGVTTDNETITLARANAWRGERGYPLRQNCWNFASFCKIGRHWGFQQERIIVCVFNAVKDAYGKEMSSGILARFKRVNFDEDSVSHFNDIMKDMDIGLIVFVAGICLCFDFRYLYTSVEKDIGQIECMQTCWNKVFNNLQRVLYVTDIPSGCRMRLSSVRPENNILQVDSAVQIGILIGGTLAKAQKDDPSGLAIGSLFVKQLVRRGTKYKSKSVKKIGDIERGDHVVEYKWWLHPRCHMIVVEVDYDRNTFDVIRFTCGRGVIEEKIKYHENIEKVIHGDARIFSPDDVIDRAKRLSPPPYSLKCFNCKHFAFWCETDTIPSEP